MGMCKPSGGIQSVTGRVGDLDREGKPNTRVDIFDKLGQIMQSWWFDAEGWLMHQRDYLHSGKGPFPHDHKWSRSGGKKPERENSHLPMDRNFC